MISLDTIRPVRAGILNRGGRLCRLPVRNGGARRTAIGLRYYPCRVAPVNRRGLSLDGREAGSSTLPRRMNHNL